MHFENLGLSEVSYRSEALRSSNEYRYRNIYLCPGYQQCLCNVTCTTWTTTTTKRKNKKGKTHTHTHTQKGLNCQRSMWHAKIYNSIKATTLKTKDKIKNGSLPVFYIDCRQLVAKCEPNSVSVNRFVNRKAFFYSPILSGQIHTQPEEDSKTSIDHSSFVFTLCVPLFV